MGRQQARGNVMSETNEKSFTCVQWLEEYAKELAKIKDSSPFLLVLGVSAGIEFLGKLLRTDDLDDSNDCKGKFEQALSNFPSLQKYQGHELYKLVRCGLAHRAAVKEGIILSDSASTDLNSNPIILNTSLFYEDFRQAVEEAQKKTDWPNPAAKSPYISVLNDSETGSTTTILNYIQ